MKCDICGNDGVITRKVIRTFGKGKNIFVIENIPMMNCPSCGESYLLATTLHEIERIKLHKSNFAVKREVAVATFG